MPLFRIRCLLHLLLLFVTTTNLATAELSSAGHGGDERALLAFKDKISSHSGVLDSWNRWWQVVALDLSLQGLGGIISPAIGNLTFLRSLVLRNNILHGKIPPTIASLRRLQRIHLGTNMLTGVKEHQPLH